MTKKLPPKICPLPWISMETTPMGGCRPCCLARDEVPGIDLRKHTIEDAYKSDYMKDLRQQFLNGEKPETCSRCWEEESAGKMSKRMNTQFRLKHLMDKIDYTDIEPDSLWFLDLKLGNKCNLKCRICGSWSSSKWAKEEMERDGGGKEHLAYKQLQLGRWPEDNHHFWDNLINMTEVEQIKYIEFTGGEPFMIKEHIDFLSNIPTEVKNTIELHYNTNGTQVHHYDFLYDFKSVEFAYSVDNIGERFEYERYGAKWDEVRSFIIKKAWINSTTFTRQLCFTINIQNVFYLDQLLMWAEEEGKFDSIHWNYLHDPWHMNVQYMTPECKRLVVDNIKYHCMHIMPQYNENWQQLINFIEAGSGSDGKVFCNYMKATDRLRKQDFADIYPHIAKAMGYE